VVNQLMTAGLSERRSCALAQISRSCAAYAQRANDDEQIVVLLRDFAQKEKRAGYWRAYCALRKQGLAINHKRVQRLWQSAKLQVPPRHRHRRRRAATKAVPLQATYPRHVFTYDFLEDSTVDGRKLRCLTIVDEFTRECLAIRVARSFRSAEVIRALAQVFAEYGPPAFIRSDNGFEFTALALCAWLYQQGIQTHHIDPASPWQNAYGESFNARFRDECLNVEEFLTVLEAQVIVETWRRKYNTQRPHSNLDDLPPAEFYQHWQAQQAQPRGAAPDPGV
jgi:putative transposase